ncbi:MAG TPA: fibronectin type III domain-containing protein [Chthoniobacterales bacterium]|nr:fibronectin type III domain-containing protein [Chthoniobacterales bacterium]
MADQAILDAIETGELILQVDTARAAGDPFKLPAARAGASTTTTVSVAAFSPLTPGASYQFWVVGVNSRGEGPASNKITFTA